MQCSFVIVAAVGVDAQELSIANLVVVERLKKSAVSIFLRLLLISLLCYLPYLSAVISLFVKGKRLPVLFNATVTIAYINSTLNPLLYCWRIREIHKAVKQTLFRLFHHHHHFIKLILTKINLQK